MLLLEESAFGGRAFLNDIGELHPALSAHNLDLLLAKGGRQLVVARSTTSEDGVGIARGDNTLQLLLDSEQRTMKLTKT